MSGINQYWEDFLLNDELCQDMRVYFQHISQGILCILLLEPISWEHWSLTDLYLSRLTHHRTADYVNHLVLNVTTTKCFSVTLFIHWFHSGKWKAANWRKFEVLHKIRLKLATHRTSSVDILVSHLHQPQKSRVWVLHYRLKQFLRVRLLGYSSGFSLA